MHEHALAVLFLNQRRFDVPGHREILHNAFRLDVTDHSVLHL